jgi:carboxymethylenebutenolidase
MPLYNDITKAPPPLPSTEPHCLSDGITLLPPLTRRGHGPGLIIVLQDHNHDALSIQEGVPSIMVKWAEERYTVVEVQQRAVWAGASRALETALGALSTCSKCEPQDKIGLIGK